MTVFNRTTIDGGDVFGFPVPGSISTYFGVKDELHPNGHSGCDIAAVEGTPIYAPAAATVCDVFALPLRGTQWDGFKQTFGNCVILDHGDRYSLYGHMSQPPLVREGQTVQQGEVLGFVGSTGFSTGPHLHWGLTLDHSNRYLNFPPVAGPIGYLADPLSLATGTPAPPPGASLDVVHALKALADAETAIEAARVALGGQ